MRNSERWLWVFLVGLLLLVGYQLGVLDTEQRVRVVALCPNSDTVLFRPTKAQRAAQQRLIQIVDSTETCTPP